METQTNDKQIPSRTRNHNQNKPHSKKKKHTGLKVFITIIVLLLLGGGVFAFNIYRNARNALDATYNPLAKGFKPARDVSDVLKQGRPFSILLMGTDTGDFGRSYIGRTDSLILATVNPKDKTTTMMSLPRDWMISIPGSEAYGLQKLNAAYEFPLNGKAHPESAISTVQSLLNVPIDFYAVVNMGGLIKTVDKVGGVDVVSPLSFNFAGYTFVKGEKYHLYGKKALEFSRMRDEDPQGDYGRQLRQRLILTALLKKSDKVQSLFTPGFFDSISSNIRTSLSFNDIMTLVANYRAAKDDIKSTNVQGIQYLYRGQSFQVVSPSAQQNATDLLRKSLNLSPADTGNRFASSTPGQVINRIPSYSQIANSGQ
ncbi:LCP family glycopolymer transferase [Periweissella fabalis]|uniref:LytR family transcriptional regulator n=1 Tax=Periweissella fabalis TaxID=1070421 RepID=A0A7X6N6I6_9LACO|nr:LCP family protein [Periweissella fabalis]MCM0599677.1 LCP family protein [Periweissella fabalis]NKZ24910.1 LytR family transcriptional regulator [Periweissella fabalis]